MLKHRLIATLLWNNGALVQSRKFSHTNAVGDAWTAVDFFNTWAIDEIILLDVTRQPKQRKFFHNQLQELSQRCFIPLAVGGWITTAEEIRELLAIGADKVVINTAAIKKPQFVSKAAEQFGNQCIVVSIDVKTDQQGKYQVYINRGKLAINQDPVNLAKTVERAGAGEIYLTSIDHDGQLKGYDLNLGKSVTKAVKIPVIASGGVGQWQHLADGIKQAKADAVSAANIFHYFDQSTKKAKEFMLSVGIEVRKPEFYNLNFPRRQRYII